MRRLTTRFNIRLARRGAHPWLPAAAVGLLGCLVAGPRVEAAPRLEPENDTVEFGNVTRGDVIEADFVLRNTGDEILRITHVNPG